MPTPRDWRHGGRQQGTDIMPRNLLTGEQDMARQTVQAAQDIFLSHDGLDGPQLIEQNSMYVGTKTEFTDATAEQILSNWESLPEWHRNELIRHRQELSAIFNGEDDRIALVVGPCSIEDIGSAERYIERMAKLQEQVKDHVKLVIRLYGEKPRTQAFDKYGQPTWWGKLAHPDPNHREPKILDAQSVVEFQGLFAHAARLGLATATEFLNVEAMQHLAHLPDFIAVGARTVGQSKYLQMAKALGKLGAIIGFKNDLSGDVQPAINSVQGISHDNPNGIVVLRGGERGDKTNFENWNQDQYIVGEKQVCVDVCHGNSNKRLSRTKEILGAIIGKMRQGLEFPRSIMLESHLTEGTLNKDNNAHSLTDPCLGFETTEAWVMELAEAHKFTLEEQRKWAK